MEIEKQRGISVATSVMGFEYDGYKVNILDTPGHKDFAEDTYRTLTAVDSVILVIDCVKGVEEQTRKLMDVCRMRSTPVMVFINKLDREGRDPFALLDELERELGHPYTAAHLADRHRHAVPGRLQSVRETAGAVLPQQDRHLRRRRRHRRPRQPAPRASTSVPESAAEAPRGHGADRGDAMSRSTKLTTAKATSPRCSSAAPSTISA